MRMNKGCRVVLCCDRPCHGQSCCGCCGKPPGLHQEGTLWQPYDAYCCLHSRREQPHACMHLQGRLRQDWMCDKEREGSAKEVQNMCSEDCLLYGGACGMMVSGRPLVRCESTAPINQEPASWEESNEQEVS